MTENVTVLNSEIKNFHIPRWNEIPSIDLYIDQVVSYLDSYLSNYICEDDKIAGNAITKTMINNYVKHGVIKPPINKKYTKEHLAKLFTIFILKQIYSIDEIKKLIQLALKTSSIEQAYDKFCSELEESIKITFDEDYTILNKEHPSHEQFILRNVVQSFSSKLYVQKVFLKK